MLPSHCRGCGHPYVWTSQILANVRRLVEQIEDLTPDDRCQLVRCIEDLVRGDLAADIKAEIARLLLDKAGAFADMMMWEIVHRIVPEHSRKRLWQPCAVKMEIRVPRLV